MYTHCTRTFGYYIIIIIIMYTVIYYNNTRYMRVNKIYYIPYTRTYASISRTARPSAPDRMIHVRPIRVLSTRKIGRTPAAGNSHRRAIFSPHVHRKSSSHKLRGVWIPRRRRQTIMCDTQSTIIYIFIAFVIIYGAAAAERWQIASLSMVVVSPRPACTHTAGYAIYIYIYIVI